MYFGGVYSKNYQMKRRVIMNELEKAIKFFDEKFKTDPDYQNFRDCLAYVEANSLAYEVFVSAREMCDDSSHSNWCATQISNAMYEWDL